MPDAELDMSWRGAVQRLRLLCPTDRPVSVRRVVMPASSGNYATCERRRRNYDVLVERWLAPKEAQHHHQLFLLSHEWAHAMAWPMELPWGHEHTAHLGVAWARAYNAIFDPAAL